MAPARGGLVGGEVLRFLLALASYLGSHSLNRLVWHFQASGLVWGRQLIHEVQQRHTATP